MNQQLWATQVLEALGIPTTQSNVNFMLQWSAAEGPWGTQTGPLNIFSLGNTYDPNAIAAWLQTNGGYGGTGTYAQELYNFLTGQSNQLAKALSYFSGGGGDTSKLTTSYQNLLSSNPLQPIQGKMTPWGGYQQPGQSAAQAVGSNVKNAASSIFTPLVQVIQSGGLLLAAAFLIGIGGLWLVLSNENTQEVVKESAKAAVVGG